MVHAQPFFPRDNWDPSQYGRHSLVSYLSDIEDADEDLVIVIHMFSHTLNYRTEIFQDRMNAISSSVRRLLDRNNKVRVLLKGPHTYKYIATYKYYMYRKIMKETFKDLYDKVVFMEQGDMTVAKNSKSIHPENDIVREAVRQMIGYVC